MCSVVYFGISKQIWDLSKYAKPKENLQNFEVRHPPCGELKELSIAHFTCLKISLKMALQIGPKHVAEIII